MGEFSMRFSWKFAKNSEKSFKRWVWELLGV